MAHKTTLNHIVDNAILAEAEISGPDGFRYETVENRIHLELGDNLTPQLIAFGHIGMRERIRKRAAKVSAKTMAKAIAKPISLHPQLFDDELQPFYPVHRGEGRTVFKKIEYLNKEELDEIIMDLQRQRKGIVAHLKALNRIADTVGPIWKDKPDMNIEEAQKLLDSNAA